MTRSDIIEIIARAAFDGLDEHGYYVGSSRNLKSVVLDGNFDLGSVADDILTALSAAGLAVVPREATEAMKEASYGYERQIGFVGNLAPRGLNHSTVFEKMVEAGDLAQDRLTDISVDRSL